MDLRTAYCVSDHLYLYHLLRMMFSFLRVPFFIAHHCIFCLAWVIPTSWLLNLLSFFSALRCLALE